MYCVKWLTHFPFLINILLYPRSMSTRPLFICYYYSYVFPNLFIWNNAAPFRKHNLKYCKKVSLDCIYPTIFFSSTVYASNICYICIHKPPFIRKIDLFLILEDSIKFWYIKLHSCHSSTLLSVGTQKWWVIWINLCEMKTHFTVINLNRIHLIPIISSGIFPPFLWY